jgi:hypothetical protein
MAGTTLISRPNLAASSASAPASSAPSYVSPAKAGALKDSRFRGKSRKGSISHPTNNKRKSGWSAERRAAHAAAMRQWKPWEKSTGPRTKAGKMKSSQNALKHGKRTIEWTLFRALMTNQKRLHHENATNELLKTREPAFLQDAIMDGAHLLRLLLSNIMQKPCIFPPPAAKRLTSSIGST